MLSLSTTLATRLPGSWPLLCLLALASLGTFAYATPVILLIQSMQWPGLDVGLVNRAVADYWLAGRLVLDGTQQDLFTQASYVAQLREMFGPTFPARQWVHPPHSLLLIWPLGFLRFKLALIVFLTTTLGVFAAAIARFHARVCPDSRWQILVVAVVPCALMLFDATQIGFLTAGLLLAGLTYKDSRPWLSGLAFALLTIRPQLVLLVPVLLLLDRDFRAVAWTVGFTGLLVAASAIAFGWEAWHAYIDAIVQDHGSVMSGPTTMLTATMPGVFGSLRSLGFTPEAAIALHWPFAIIAAALIACLLYRETDRLVRAFLLTSGTILIVPYAFNYDMGALAVVAALLVGSKRVGGGYLLLAIAVVAGLPAAVTNLGRSGLPITPLLLLAAVVLLATRHRFAGKRGLTRPHAPQANTR